MRFLKEFFNPSLKCKRIGHDEQWRMARQTRQTDPFSRSVAEDWKVKRKQCRHCGKKLSEWEDVKYLTFWTSISWPSDMMRTFEKQGYLIRASWWLDT